MTRLVKDYVFDNLVHILLGDNLSLVAGKKPYNILGVLLFLSTFWPDDRIKNKNKKLSFFVLLIHFRYFLKKIQEIVNF